MAWFRRSRGLSRRGRKARPALPLNRPTVEALEDRTLLSGDPSLSLVLASHSIPENAGPGATTGTVTRNNMDNTVPLTVNLASSNTSQAAVPASVVIPAGATSATFNVDAVDNHVIDPPQLVTVTGTAPSPLPAGLDTTFGSGGLAGVSLYYSSSANFPDVKVQADGKIVAVAASPTSGATWAVSRTLANGSPDTAFGINGTVTTTFTGAKGGYANGVAIQPDGKIVVVGTITGLTTYDDWGIARYNPDGTPDTTFGSGGQVVIKFTGEAGWLYDVAVLPNGELLVGGMRQDPNGFAVARLTSTGQVDTTFGTNGFAGINPDPADSWYNTTGQAMMVQPDGKILMTGIANYKYLPVVRFNANGTPDTSFNGTGVQLIPDAAFGAQYTSSVGQGLALQPDGRILVSGYVRGSNDDFAVARLNPDGSLDTGFNGTGVRALDFGGGDDIAYDVAVQADGKIIQAGQAVIPGTGFFLALARYNPNGSLDTSFNGTGTMTTKPPAAFEAIWAIDLQTDGKLVALAGYTSSMQVVRYDTGLLAASDTLTVTDTDGSPVANNDSYQVNENQVLTVTAPGVLGNDQPGSSTPLQAALVTGPAHGTLTLNSDGSFTYTPATNFNGTDSFTCQAIEGGVASNTATVTITVNFVNQPPVAQNDAYSVLENQTLTVSPTTPVTSLTMNSQPGDYIGQGQTYSYTSATGTFGVQRNFDNGVSFNYTDSANPSYVWWYLDFAAPADATLVPGYYGNAARFPFQSSNQPGLDVRGEGRGSNTLTGNFTVKEAAYDSTGNVTAFDAFFEQHSEGATPALFGEIKYNAPGGPSGVLANDTDPENKPLTAILVSGPAHGTLTLNSDGSFTYTPSTNYNGTDSFTYVANDGSLNSNVATVTITVTPVNQPPSFTKGSDQSIPEGSGPQTVNGWATNISPGPPNEANQTVQFLVSTDNSGLFAVPPAIDPSGNLTYTPKSGALGTATVTVRLKDNGGTANGGVDTSAPQTFTITVYNVAPTVTPPADQSATEGIGTGIALGSFTDPGPDGPWAVDVNWGDNSGDTTYNAAVTGSLGSLTHTYADEGSYTVTVKVTDNGNAAGSNTFKVAVKDAAPVVTLGSDLTLNEGDQFAELAHFTDSGADTWTATVDYGDGGGAQPLALNTDKTFNLYHAYPD